MRTESPTTLSATPVSLSQAPTVLVPPPPQGRRAKKFEYQESAVEQDLSDHVERALAEADGYPSLPVTQIESQKITRRLRRIYLRMIGKKGMYL